MTKAIYQLAAITDALFGKTLYDITIFPNGFQESSYTPTYPKTNIFTTKNNDVVIESAVPGFKKEEITVQIEGNILRINGEQGEREELDEDVYLSRQLAQRNFENEYTLSPRLDRDRIKVTVKDGLLRVSIPLKEEEKPRKIDITIQ
jgi:HSP20 family protein